LVCTTYYVQKNLIKNKKNTLEKIVKKEPEKITEKKAIEIIYKILGYDSPNTTLKYEPVYKVLINKCKENEECNEEYINLKKFKKELRKEIEDLYSPDLDL